MDKRPYCKKHPSHKQAKGVCPFCLREKLYHITPSSSSAATTISSPNYSPDNSISPSLVADFSPLHDDPNSNKKSLSFLIKGEEQKQQPLKKSRSLAFVMEEEEEKEKNDSKKRRRFWSKLMKGRRKEEDKEGGMLHSKTMKEKVSTKWVVFA